MTPLSESPKISLENVKNIAYFQGCAMKLFFKNASLSTENLIKKTGYIAHKPTTNCCGLPQQAHGMIETAKKMARENIDAYRDFDLIITDCASCGSMLKSYTQLFADDFTYKNKAKCFSEKVMGLSEYLDAVGYHATPHKELRVTYHSPCHLNRAQGVQDIPEKLLEQQTTYLPSENKEMCCGGAGTFQLDFPETSQKILDFKYKDFKKSGADIVVTECPSCLMQLGKLEKYKDLKVLHISQVL